HNILRLTRIVWHSRSPMQARLWLAWVEPPSAVGLESVAREKVRVAQPPSAVHTRSCLQERKYSYRRNLPHFEKSGRAHFITFDTYERWQLPPVARDLVLKHCLHDNGTKMQLYIAVVMPDHVHMIFLPLEAET